MINKPVRILIVLLILHFTIISSMKSNKSSKKRKADNLNLSTQNILDKEARYAINYLPAIIDGNSSSLQSSGAIAAATMADIMSHIKNPWKHDIGPSVLAGLYILALISLFVFATTGTISFLCSFSDCTSFFINMNNGSNFSGRSFYGNIISQSFNPFTRIISQTENMEPAFKSFYESIVKYNREEETITNKRLF